MALKPNLFVLNLLDFTNKNCQLEIMAVSMETVLMAKYGCSKNQSEHFDFPQVYLTR